MLGNFPCDLAVVYGENRESRLSKNMILEEIITPQKLLKAMHECENGVRWKSSTQRFEINTLLWAATIKRQVLSGKFKSRGFHCFDIVERGKARHIQAVHISERPVHKLFRKHVIDPVIEKEVILYNSASQKGKGTDFAVNGLISHLRQHLDVYGRKGAIAIMDYQDYFGSIPHKKCADSLCAFQTDKRINYYIRQFINDFDGEKGLGLGSEISQSCAVYYPTPIDKYITEELGITCYGRYNDDCYLIHPDRKYLESCLNKIKDKTLEYGLIIHGDKTKIHNLASDDFTFLKKRVHISETNKIILRLTRKNLSRERKRIRQHKEEYISGNIPLTCVMQSYQCWRSYAQRYNAYKEVGKMDRFFADVFGLDIRKDNKGKMIRFKNLKR